MIDGKQQIVVQDPTGKPWPNLIHAAFRVKLKDHEASYVVDLAGNQFGEDTPVVEWTAYRGNPFIKSHEAKQGAWHTQQYAKRENSRILKLQFGGQSQSTHAEIRDLTQSYVTNRMHFAVEDFCTKHEVTLPGLLREGEYCALESLMWYVEKTIKEFVKYIKANGGILKLDERVRASTSSSTEKNPSFRATNKAPIHLPEGSTYIISLTAQPEYPYMLDNLLTLFSIAFSDVTLPQSPVNDLREFELFFSA